MGYEWQITYWSVH